MSWLQVSVGWWSQVGAKSHIPVILVNLVWFLSFFLIILSYFYFFYPSFPFVSIFLSPFLVLCPPPGSPSKPQTPGRGLRLRRNPTFYLLDFFFFSFFFFFSHSNFPFPSYRPGHPTPPGLFWSCWVIQWPSTISPMGPYYSFSSHLSASFPLRSPLIPSLHVFPLGICPSHGES